jgi:hypothetical protein
MLILQSEHDSRYEPIDLMRIHRVIAWAAASLTDQNAMEKSNIDFILQILLLYFILNSRIIRDGQYEYPITLKSLYRRINIRSPPRWALFNLTGFLITIVLRSNHYGFLPRCIYMMHYPCSIVSWLSC